MKVKESLKQGKHTSKKFFIIEFICIVVIILSVFIMSDRIEKEKPNATDLSQNGAIGTEAGKYVYLQIDGLSDEIAIGPDDEKYYVAINDGVGYIVSLSSVELEELNNIHEYTYGNIENRPASVNVYGITKEVPDDLKQIAIDFFNEGLDDEQKITVDQFEDYFGSVLLDTSENPVDVSLEDNVEETFFNDKLIVTKDFLVDTTGETFVAVKFSDIKWIYTHRLKYYGVVSISNNIIILLNDGKTQFQCLDTKGKISDEFEKAFDKICDKLPNDSLKGYTQENIIEFKEFKKNLKSNI